ncbi:hypothetical protein [Rhodococcus sp. DMU1]|uniref:hypothetical protein n=1 Tax=Rhodococcus sp. DMU1 TaxID=2722825 RepID=UPI00143E5D63|nr:hypothetical protein [Rhodococcus sp. DMU1]QIX53640.1 hypothetical protein HFP48_28760 [Rhodococcus sp. DMU1]
MPERIVEFSTWSGPRTYEELVDADAVELDIESLDRYEHAALGVRAMYATANLPTPPLLVRINTCLAATAREAMREFERTVGRGSEAHRKHVWFVGTENGLRGLVQDLQVLRLGDGVSCVPAPQLAASAADDRR